MTQHQAVLALIELTTALQVLNELPTDSSVRQNYVKLLSILFRVAGV
jgi:hypothetical protein